MTALADGSPAARFAVQRAAFSFDRVPTIAERRTTLRLLGQHVLRRRDALAAAMAADFGGRSWHESMTGDVMLALRAIAFLRRNLARLSRDQWGHALGSGLPGRTRLRAMPKGVVGVIGPWNYPFQLALIPALTAYAAGNRVLIKPSELTPQTTEALADLIAAVFAPDTMAVCAGDREVGAAFAALPFDHLFFTGSTAVGKAVAQAAAANLTPVTLELGGKSPCILLPDADLGTALPMIGWGKAFNAGQTCVAPDYLMVPTDQMTAVSTGLLRAWTDFYGPAGRSEDLAGIISARHLARLEELIRDAVADGATALTPDLGVEGRRPRHRLAPTLLLGVRPTSAIMQEEIFGPVLPIVTYDDVAEVVAMVNGGPAPLAVYVFGRDTAAARAVLDRLRGGTSAINACNLQFAVESLPFGGIGASGQGVAHGAAGFETFVHRRPTLEFIRSRTVTRMLTPPYGWALTRFLSAMMGDLRAQPPKRTDESPSP